MDIRATICSARVITELRSIHDIWVDGRTQELVQQGIVPPAVRTEQHELNLNDRLLVAFLQHCKIADLEADISQDVANFADLEAEISRDELANFGWLKIVNEAKGGRSAT